MSKVLSPIGMKFRIPQNVDIVKAPWIPQVQVKEKTIVVNDHCVVISIHFLSPIEKCSMLVLWSPDFDQSAIYKTNIAR